MNIPTEHDHDVTGQLKRHGLRRTAFREGVLEIFHQEQGRALSTADIEVYLEEGFDRITLYRTLKSFEEHGLVHQLIDADGVTKYAICGHQCDSTNHDDGHAHFHCTKCGQTECLYESLKSLSYNIPDRYQVKETRVMLTGICARCA